MSKPLDNPTHSRPDEANGHALLLRADEVARLLACSRRLIWRLRSEGLLPAVKVGPKTTRWKRETVLEYVDALLED